MNDAEFFRCMRELEAKEAFQPEGWQWLSFADEAGCRGVAIVKARGLLDALRKTRARGMNPGGELLLRTLPAEALTPEQDRMLEDFSNRSLLPHEAECLKADLRALN